MNGKILTSLLVIGIVIGLTGGATFAYFSDTETSSGNMFMAGTLNLDISGSEEGVVAWSISPMAPGDSETGTVTLINNGNLAADHVEVDFTVTVTNVVTPAEIGADDVDISDSMDVTTMTYGATNLLSQTVAGTFDNDALEAADNAGNNDGIIQLNELNGVNLDDLTPAPTPNGGTNTFVMTVQLQTGTGNGNQGDSVALDVLFTLNQHSSQ